MKKLDIKQLFRSVRLTKIGAILGLTILVSALAIVPETQARVTPKGLAITGLVLGGTALGVAGYNAYRNRQFRRRYQDRYFERDRGFRPASSRRFRNRNCRRYQPRYTDSYYYHDDYYY